MHWPYQCTWLLRSQQTSCSAAKVFAHSRNKGNYCCHRSVHVASGDWVWFWCNKPDRNWKKGKVVSFVKTIVKWILNKVKNVLEPRVTLRVPRTACVTLEANLSAVMLIYSLGYSALPTNRQILNTCVTRMMHRGRQVHTLWKIVQSNSSLVS